MFVVSDCPRFILMCMCQCSRFSLPLAREGACAQSSSDVHVTKETYDLRVKDQLGYLQRGVHAKPHLSFSHA
jgi:hypothetical protein